MLEFADDRVRHDEVLDAACDELEDERLSGRGGLGCGGALGGDARLLEKARDAGAFGRGRDQEEYGRLFSLAGECLAHLLFGYEYHAFLGGGFTRRLVGRPAVGGGVQHGVVGVLGCLNDDGARHDQLEGGGKALDERSDEVRVAHDVVPFGAVDEDRAEGFGGYETLVEDLFHHLGIRDDEVGCGGKDGGEACAVTHARRGGDPEAGALGHAGGQREGGLLGFARGGENQGGALVAAVLKLLQQGRYRGLEAGRAGRAGEARVAFVQDFVEGAGEKRIGGRPALEGFGQPGQHALEIRDFFVFCHRS